MNNLVELSSSKELTMSSKEIAELTGKEHGHVIRDIRKMLTDLYQMGDDPDLDHLSGVSETTDNRGYTSCFNLDYNHTMTLVAGYNTKLRFAIVKRWQELEAKVKETEIAISWRKLDAEIQKDAMRVLKETLVETYGEEVGKAEYIKANTILNKATSNLYGFEKMVKKPDMNQLMLEDRQRACKKFAHMLLAGIEPKDCKEILYKMFKPKELPAPAESK